MSNVTLNTKLVEVLVFRHLSGAFVTSVTALVCQIFVRVNVRFVCACTGQWSIPLLSSRSGVQSLIVSKQNVTRCFFPLL